MAEYVRRYNWKHDNFNKHRKYQPFKPLYPLKLDPEKVSEAILASSETPFGESQSCYPIKHYELDQALQKEGVEFGLTDGGDGAGGSGMSSHQSSFAIAGQIAHRTALGGQSIDKRPKQGLQISLGDIQLEKALHRL